MFLKLKMTWRILHYPFVTCLYLFVAWNVASPQFDVTPSKPAIVQTDASLRVGQGSPAVFAMTDASNQNSPASSDESSSTKSTPSNVPAPQAGKAGQPVQAGQPSQPSQPVQPVQAGQPSQPSQPVQPVQPVPPGLTTQTGLVAQPGQAGAQGQGSLSGQPAQAPLGGKGGSKDPNRATQWNKICDIESPTPEIWRAHNIDGFLESYPNSKNLTIAEFTRQNGVLNFVCGIGESCNAGQICAPTPGPVWHILYAIQQWNHVQESLDKAITFSASMLNTVGSGLSIDLFKQDMKKSHRLFKISNILALVVAVMAVVCAVAFFWLPGGNFVLAGIAAGAAAAIATGQASAGIMAQKAYDNAKSDAFSRWSEFAGYIAQWETDLHQKSYTAIKLALESGIGDEKGFGGLLKNGTFFTNTLDKTTEEIESALTKVVTARLINRILHAKKAFVTVGSNSCDKGGPDGAFKLEDGWLSYCKDGRMMNVIYAKGSKVGNKFYNAAAIPRKYNVSVEYMTTQSDNCQKKYGGFNHDPYENSTLPSDINADCIFNLPVCYIAETKSIRKYRRKHGTVKACRHKKGLPI